MTNNLKDKRTDSILPK